MRLGVCLIRWFVKFQQPNPFLKFNLSHLNKIILTIRKGDGKGKINPCHIEVGFCGSVFTKGVLMYLALSWWASMKSREVEEKTLEDII